MLECCVVLTETLKMWVALPKESNSLKMWVVVWYKTIEPIIETLKL